MFKRNNISIISNPCCSKKIGHLEKDYFLYFDKDGFELNQAEQLYYRESGYELENCLNHVCFQQPWFKSEVDNLILDHSLVLQRCCYEDAAKAQLLSIKKDIPQASLLLEVKAKWGFDFALDSIDSDGNIFEVLHVEYDSRHYETFLNKMLSFEFLIRHTDWIEAARSVLAHKDQWTNLKGFEQNHWKAEFLIGWKKAEYTEKTQ